MTMNILACVGAHKKEINDGKQENENNKLNLTEVK